MSSWLKVGILMSMYTLSPASPPLQSPALLARSSKSGPIREEAPFYNLTFVTWNLAMCSPTVKDCAFLKECAEDSSILVLGFQEVEDLKPRRSEGRKSRLLRRRLQTVLSSTHSAVSMTTHGSTQLIVYVRKDQMRLIRREEIQTWAITCGVGNVVQNKGALGIAMKVNGESLVCITAHLAAHQHKVKARNEDYKRIVKQSEKILLNSLSGNSRARARDPRCTGLFGADCVVFGGDLNYRLDLSREEVGLCLGADSELGYSDLCDYDQLTKARASGAAFALFQEGPVLFPPTFKFDKGTDNYDSSKKRRVPAWTDRILYTPSEAAELVDYRSVAQARRSDHRPVVATFKIGKTQVKRS